MSTPIISVIIPTRNRLAFLRDAVASVQTQSFGDWELIVVDDASEDGTWDWLGSLDDSRIHPIRMAQRRERSAARNAGLRTASAEYVLFLDDDDWLLDGALAHLMRALQAHDDAIAAVGARLLVWTTGWRLIPRPLRPYFGNTWQDALFGWAPQCGQVLLRRTVVEQAGGWKDDYVPAEDHDLWVRLSRLGPAVLIPQPVLAWRFHRGQTPRESTWRLCITLRRRAVANEGEDERQRAERSIRAERLIRLAWRAHQRGRHWRALDRWCQAVLSAPWLLMSPPSRVSITHAGVRCIAGVMLNDRLIGILRTVKRACTPAQREALRPPASGAPPARTFRGTDSQP